ncbi:hypothetical protein [Burkholderia cepacia]|uniref:hypothetical protein n=1 Tax=Burkholderia cepacia TaxID=292 RepID=UPI00075262E9|nr:hypothetical protein [Burkholderia cepacia]KWH43852.1 hypothetical protein WM00_34280 [Burkholderia cepacia]OUE36848.1 hypothetical protein BZY94_38685 [Burkholderia territorii]HDR9499698.1 hypothetical protein [Burkholderia cepacia]
MPTQSVLRFTFTAGDESFEVVEFTLHEGLSKTFLLQVELASANPAIDFGQVHKAPERRPIGFEAADQLFSGVRSHDQLQPRNGDQRSQ